MALYSGILGRHLVFTCWSPAGSPVHGLLPCTQLLCCSIFWECQLHNSSWTPQKNTFMIGQRSGGALSSVQGKTREISNANLPLLLFFFTFCGLWSPISTSAKAAFQLKSEDGQVPKNTVSSSLLCSTVAFITSKKSSHMWIYGRHWTLQNVLPWLSLQAVIAINLKSWKWWDIRWFWILFNLPSK